MVVSIVTLGEFESVKHDVTVAESVGHDVTVTVSVIMDGKFESAGQVWVTSAVTVITSNGVISGHDVTVVISVDMIGEF